MCKHVAAVLYGVGARLDQEPQLFFALRGVDMQELMKAATASAVRAPKAGASAAAKAIDDDDLSEIFGVEIETAPPVPARPNGRGTKKKPAAKRGLADKLKATEKAKPVAKAQRRTRGVDA